MTARGWTIIYHSQVSFVAAPRGYVSHLGSNIEFSYAKYSYISCQRAEKINKMWSFLFMQGNSDTDGERISPGIWFTFPKDHNGQDWDKPKSGTRNFI